MATTKGLPSAPSAPWAPDGCLECICLPALPARNLYKCDGLDEVHSLPFRQVHGQLRVQRVCSVCKGVCDWSLVFVFGCESCVDNNNGSAPPKTLHEAGFKAHHPPRTMTVGPGPESQRKMKNGKNVAGAQPSSVRNTYDLLDPDEKI